MKYIRNLVVLAVIILNILCMGCCNLPACDNEKLNMETADRAMDGEDGGNGYLKNDGQNGGKGQKG